MGVPGQFLPGFSSGVREGRGLEEEEEEEVGVDARYQVWARA